MLGGSASPANMNRRSRGTWSAGATYLVNDIVSDAGSSYICKIVHSNQQPPNATYWDLLAAGFNATPNSISVLTDTSTTSSTDVLMDSMTYTPPAGTWCVIFSTSGSGSQNASDTKVSVYKAGTQLVETRRHLAGNTDGNLITHAIVTVTGSEAVEIRYSVSSGTVTVHERLLNFMRIGD